MTPAPPGTFALHLLDVGQGEAILLDLPNNAFALIDGGPASAREVIQEAVKDRQRALEGSGARRYSAPHRREPSADEE